MKTHYEIVSTAADYARSLANRAAMSGQFGPLKIYAQKHALIVVHCNDPADCSGLHYCGEIRGDVPYSSYWQRIADMTRSAPIF